VSCDGWRQQAWLTRGPRGSDWLDEHNGGRLRANPPRSSGRRVRANPSGQVPVQDSEEPLFCERCARVDHVKVQLERGMTHCPECHEPIEWPEDQENVDPDIGM